MTQINTFLSAGLLCGVVAGAAMLGLSAQDQPSKEPATAAPIAPKTLEARVLEAAEQYKTWTRISDEAHWSPKLCRVPPPEGAQLSQSTDGDSHGRKLYFLFAKNAAAYRALARVEGATPPKEGAAAPTSQGQVLVKESWTFKEVPADAVPKLPRTGEVNPREHAPEYAFADGKAFKTDAPSGLFVMLKLDPKTPDTDEGWVYATVSPEKKVTSIGKVASCMECHVKAKQDRQFGPVWARAKAAEKPGTSPAPAPAK